MAAVRALCLLLALLPVVCGEDDANVTEQNSGGVAIKFRGRSGKFTIFSASEGESDKNKITFAIDELRELDINGNEVGTKGKLKHQLKSFAKTEFNFTVDEKAQIGTAEASVVTFVSNIEGVGLLKVETYLIQTKGVVGPNMSDPESEQWDTFAGDVKFNIELSEWKWCGDGATCTDKGKDQIGAFIDVDIEVKGQKSKPEKKQKGGGKHGKGKKFDLGGGVAMDLTSDVDVDGANDTMPDGYPMIKTKGSKQIFTFRFPKFSTRAVYDPLLSTSASLSLEQFTGLAAHQYTQHLLVMLFLVCALAV